MRPDVRVLTAIALAAVLAGCTISTAGRAVAPANHAPRPVASNDVDSVLMTPAQLSQLVKAPLQVRVDRKQPVGAGWADPCAGLDAAGARSFVGNDYTAFHVLLLADGTEIEHDHVVTEAATVYADAQTAAKQFAAASAGLGTCNGRRVYEEAEWTYAVSDVTADTVRWNRQQTDAPEMWVCYGQARVRNNVIIEAMACQGSDTGAENVDTLVSRMSASVWELSGA